MKMPIEITVEVSKGGKSLEVPYEKFIDIVVDKQRSLRVNDVTSILDNINKLHEEGELDGELLNLSGFTFKLKK